MALGWLSKRQSAWGESTSSSGANPMRFFAAIAIAIFLVGAIAGYAVRLVTHEATGAVGGGGGGSKTSNSTVIANNVDSMVTAPQTPEGAVRAATSFVTGFPNLALESQLHQTETLQKVVSQTADPTLLTDVASALSSVRTQLVTTTATGNQANSRLVYAPASYKVSMKDQTHADVVIWYSTAAINLVDKTSQAQWATNTIGLTWSDHWRLSSYDSKEGPTPTTLTTSGQPSTYDEVFSVFDGFTAFRSATPK